MITKINRQKVTNEKILQVTDTALEAHNRCIVNFIPQYSVKSKLNDEVSKIGTTYTQRE